MSCSTWCFQELWELMCHIQNTAFPPVQSSMSTFVSHRASGPDSAPSSPFPRSVTGLAEPGVRAGPGILASNWQCFHLALLHSTNTK